jgi:hypothetical protein
MLMGKTHNRAVRAVDLLSLAQNKLFRCDLGALEAIFAAPSTNDTKHKILTILGPRLSIQTGSFTTTARELVASHMMVLLKVAGPRTGGSLLPERTYSSCGIGVSHFTLLSPWRLW